MKRSINARKGNRRLRKVPFLAGFGIDPVVLRGARPYLRALNWEHALPLSLILFLSAGTHCRRCDSYGPAGDVDAW